MNDVFVLPEQHAAAVELGLEEPARTHGQRLRRRDELQPDSAWHEGWHGGGLDKKRN